MTTTTTGPVALEDALCRLLPSCSTYSVVSISEDHKVRIPKDLIPAAAVPKRQREFAAGRVAASNALLLSGRSDYFPTVGDLRQPIWPRGFTGSISHDSEVAAAVTARESQLKGIGLDIESVHLPDKSIRAQIMTRLEQELWTEQCDGNEDAATMMIFSYKEAIFKCVFPLTGIFLEFLDVIVHPPSTLPIARCSDSDHPTNAIVEKLVGRVDVCGERILTACWLRND